MLKNLPCMKEGEWKKEATKPDQNISQFLGASKYGHKRMLCSSETQIDGFGGSKNCEMLGWATTHPPSSIHPSEWSHQAEIDEEVEVVVV